MKGHGRLVVLGSVRMFDDEWLDKEANGLFLDMILQWLLRQNNFEVWKHNFKVCLKEKEDWKFHIFAAAFTILFGWISLKVLEVVHHETYPFMVFQFFLWLSHSWFVCLYGAIVWPKCEWRIGPNRNWTCAWHRSTFKPSTMFIAGNRHASIVPVVNCFELRMLASHVHRKSFPWR